MDPLRWEHRVTRNTAQGYRVIVKGWPGQDAAVQELDRYPWCRRKTTAPYRR
jgi:hypothetical protein